MGGPRRSLADVGVQQLGVVPRADLLAAGLSSTAMQRATREWPALLPGVYWTTPNAAAAALQRQAPPHGGWMAVSEVPWEVRARAALLRWSTARLAETSAAHVEGWAMEPTDITLLLPWDQRAKTPAGVRIGRERPGVRAPSRPADLRRTRPEDTVLDIVDRLPQGRSGEVFTWLARALGRRVTRPDLVAEALARRHQIRHRRELVGALEDATSGTASQLERRFVTDVHRRHGLPPMRQQLRLASPEPRAGGQRVSFVDVAYEAQCVLVELDGRLGHAGEGAFRDRRRDNANTLAGWTTLRFGWHDVVGDPCGVAADVRTALALGGWREAAKKLTACCT